MSGAAALFQVREPNAMPAWSETYTFLDGQWIEGNTPFIGARTHAFWLGSSVFDGARAFEGVTPDLDRHCARLNRSARTMWLKPIMSEEAIVELAREGMRKFKPGRRTLYPPDVLGRARRRYLGATRPGIDPLLSQHLRGAAAAADWRVDHPLALHKPTRRTMPIDAKAGCLYPNNARALIEAQSRGFGNCLLCDMLGNVAELATANIFMAKDGVVMTPMANGTFLNGVTRQRVLKLLRADGKDVSEATLAFGFRRGRRNLCRRQLWQGHARSGGSTAATCSRGRSTDGRANSIGSSPMLDPEAGAERAEGGPCRRG